MNLQIDQTLVIDVNPAQRYNATGIDVNLDEIYRFTAKGLWQDASQSPCGPTGWRNWWTPYVLRFSRLPDHDLFYLGGNVGQNESGNFPIGKAAVIPIENAGPLFLFANDLWYFYWNNHRVENQPLLVEIRRIA